MIASIVVDTKTGEPIDGNGRKLSVSTYNPPEEIKKLFARVQTDYQMAWRLQHRTFDEFDGMSLLDRSKLDQQTFGAYVGAVQEPVSKQWRWKGRKNTARNKVIGILAHLISGMLFPYCYAYNEENEEDEMTARVMRILIENHLKKADYEIKFLYMVTSALVNPAVHVEVEYIEAIQKIKEKGKDGKAKITEVVDELLSGVGLHLLPIDQILPADFFTNDIQRQPFMIKLRRIAYDEAREIYAGKYFDDDNGTKKDRFDYVEAGRTRLMLAGQEHQTLYDIEWTEADKNYVQELTVYYRPEDLQVTFVAGVFMGEYEDPYNSNPFEHRRMSMIGDEYKSIPVYPFAKTGFEPLDPAGRFYYYKSACFKEFWDDAAQNRMHQLAYDGTYLDVIKPIFMTGVARIDQTVMVPGATVGMPMGATVTPYALSPNLVAAMNMMREEQADMSESTQDKAQSGLSQPGVTATATMKAEQNAQVILGVFGTMIANLIKQIGELTVDCIIQHTTVGEIDATIPESLNMKYKTIILKGKEAGKDVTNKIEFDSSMMNGMTKEKAYDLQWKMFDQYGGLEAKTMHYKVNPYKFARSKFAVYIDPDQIVSRSMGTDKLRKDRAFNLLMDPRVAPFVNQQAVVDKFIIDEYADGNPDEFRKTPEQMEQAQQGQQGQSSDLLANVMGSRSASQ
ncbi:MAG: hypothetical protein WCO06_01480 [Candidatus Roizmanbacteria bacterium]